MTTSTAAPADPLHWATVPAADAVGALGSGPAGLSAEEAAARLEKVGPNGLRTHRVSAWRVLLRQFRNAVLLLLLGTAIVAALLGDASDAAVIAVILLASTGLGFVNEYRAERTSAALQDSLQHKSVVLRDGAPVTVPSTELVPGDVVRLSLGALVPADLRIVAATDLECDEGVLTGESTPQAKTTEPVAASSALGELTSMAFMGTVVKQGEGSGVVVATGPATQIGRIAAGLDTAAPETAFQAGLRRFSYLLVTVAAVLVALIIVSGVLLGRPLVDTLLFALAIAVGITPQLLPAVVNTSLANGAKRLARQRVLVKRLVCIEDLGNVTVLVTDKTGTLTTGSIAFEASYGADGEPSPATCLLAAEGVEADAGSGSTGELDQALLAAAEKLRAAQAAAGQQAAAQPAGGGAPSRIVAVIPFDHERRMASAVVDRGAGGRLLITRGAPENVLALCGDVPQAVRDRVESELARGARLIAVASRAIAADEPADASAEHDLVLAGLLAFVDPPRLDARESLERLDGLGVRIVIATGDHPAVAAHVASELGLGDVAALTGAEIDGLSDAELAERLRTILIVARVSPEQKARVVRLLRGEGETVGFLGDGVNDSLGLHAADVGISVDTATDVAKNAADVLLLDKDLDVVADGVAEGRTIFANTIKYVFMAASGNFGNMISAGIASAFLPFLPMLPGQILLSNLLYDASQLTISSDRVDPDALGRPARWDIGAIRRFMLVFGPLSSVFDLVTFALLLGVFHAGAAEFRTGWFLESLVSQALVVFVIRTRRYPFIRSRPSLPLALAVAAIIAIAIALPYSPLAPLLGFVVPRPGLLLALAGVVVAYLVVADFAKRLFYLAEGNREKRVVPNRRLRRVTARFTAR